MTKETSNLERGDRHRTRNKNHRDGWVRYAKPTKFTALYQRFPTTFTLLAPYVFLILPPAVAFKNPGVWFLIGVASIAVTGTFLAEIFGVKWRKTTEPRSNAAEYGQGLFWLAFIAIAGSSVVAVAAAYGGKGSVAVQIGIADASAGLFGALDSLIRGWVIVGIGMLCAAYIGGRCTRKAFFLTIAIPLLANLINAALTQRTAPLFSLVTFLAMMMMLLGIVKARVVIIGIVATLIIWPTVFELRNELRVDDGVRVSQEVSAFDRLRFDLQFSRAEEIEVPLDVQVPSHLQHPSVVDILRFGLVPRFLDSDRPIVSTGQVINVALGGTVTSAYTFGPVTTAYVLEGPAYLFFFYFLIAVCVNMIWRSGTRITPNRLIFLALLLYGPLGWFSTFPDASIGALQSIVAATPLMLFLFLIRIMKRKNTTRVIQ